MRQNTILLIGILLYLLGLILIIAGFATYLFILFSELRMAASSVTAFHI